MLHYHLKKRPPVFDPPYSSFLRSCPDSENEKIDIDIFYEDPPSLQKKPVFTMEQAWSIHLNDHFYFIDVVLPPQIPGQWRARFQPDSANISIYYQGMAQSKNEAFNPFAYPLDQLLTMFLLSIRNGLLIHAAGGEFKGNSILFIGTSGAGKSTISKLLSQSGDWHPMSDDRMIVRKLKTGFHAFGTPWPGESKIAESKTAPLKALFFLKQSRSNDIKRLDSRQIIERLLPTTSILWFDRNIFDLQLKMCEDLIENIPSYELSFNLECPVSDLIANISCELS